MKRLLQKTGRFFWSWRFIKIALWTATVIVLFYVEEDWRGARDWAATKAKWKARGETFDFNRLIPPPIPDAQNLAALPLFKLEPDTNTRGIIEPPALRRALRNDQPGSNFPVGATGGSINGEPPDFGKIRIAVAAAYAQAFVNSPTVTDPLAQFEALYPVVGDLRVAAKERPYCRFSHSYTVDSPSFSLGLITDQIRVAKIISIHAILALAEHQPEVALGDIHANLQISAGLRTDPILLSGLVAIGVAATTLPVIHDGLATHAWTDNQITGLEKELGSIDFVANYQLCMRGEALVMLPEFERVKQQGVGIWPTGWIDQLRAHGLDFDFTGVRFFDDKSKVVKATRVDDFAKHAEDQQAGSSLWRILDLQASGPVISAARNFALAQANADMARIACALERYRLGRALYPETLDALAPAFIDALPHDIMDGAPYHYRLLPKGGYLLYSVGWNQKDDGGKLVYDKKCDLPVNYPMEGDWPWIMPK